MTTDGIIRIWKLSARILAIPIAHCVDYSAGTTSSTYHIFQRFGTEIKLFELASST